MGEGERGIGMQTHLRGRDLITLQEWTKEEIDTALEVAFQLKRERALGIPHALLRDRVLAMLFFFSSTRTRASFEAGMAQLGGHAQFIESRTTQIAHGDTAKEIGEILGRYNDGIAIRNVDWRIGNPYLREVAEASRVPVLNMQCDVYHPFQALADLLTIVEKKGDPRGITATVSWAYAASYQKPISVPQSLALLLPRFGINVRLVHPPEFALMPEVMEQARENARAGKASFEVMDDFDRGIEGTDVVYAKSWGALLTTQDEAEGAAIIDRYKDWIADERRLATAPDAVYMHPLPADRGVEVADAVIDGPQSVVYDQAENRLHGQKAVMALTMR
jgi:N-acetylornithine carbamoyltransferase